MRNAVLVVMVLLLAVMVATPVSARGGRQVLDGEFNRDGSVITGPGFVIGTNGGPSVIMRRPDGSVDTGNGSSGYGGGRRGTVVVNRSGGYGYDDRGSNYGYSSGRRTNSNRTGISVGLGTRIGGVRVNLGYNKVTYSKPKPKPRVIAIPKPPTHTPTPVTNKCLMTLVQEVGDGLETISPIVVTNPEKVLVAGTHIVFNRAGKFFAEYTVLRVSGDSVFVETIDAPRGNPRQGDTFKITSAE